MNLVSSLSFACVAGYGTALPSTSYSQETILEFILKNFDVEEKTRDLYRRTLSNPSVRKRQFALTSLEQVMNRDLDHANKRFRCAAVQLGTTALNKALAHAEISPQQLDFLATTTCTGYLCPGLSSYFIESAGLCSDIRVADLAGMGCGAALPALEQAVNFVQNHPGSIAAVVCTEICSATFFSNNDPDIVISNTLFSDGSAAVIVRNVIPAERSESWDPVVQAKTGFRIASADGALARNDGPLPQFLSFASQTFPEWRDTLKFDTEGGRLKNVLGRQVPHQAAQAFHHVVQSLLSQSGLSFDDIHHWIVHPGGEKVLSAIQRRFELNPRSLEPSRNILRDYGNMSSPSVLFVMEESLRIHPPITGEIGVMISFGAGFTAHGALLRF